MSDSSISILILDTDQIFLLGLATALSKDSRYKIIDQADNLTDIFIKLSTNSPDIIIFEPNLFNSFLAIKQFCIKIRREYPSIRLCCLSRYFRVEEEKEFQKIGIRGYFDKNIEIDVLINNLDEVIQNKFLYKSASLNHQFIKSRSRITNNNWVSRIQRYGLKLIEDRLIFINETLKKPSASKLKILFWKGRRRELLVVSYLLEKLFSINVLRQKPNKSNNQIKNDSFLKNFWITNSAVQPVNSLIIFNRTLEKIEKNTSNFTRVYLEIDILEGDKRRELLKIVTKHLYRIIEDINFIEIENKRVIKSSLSVLQKLWREASLIFIEKYCKLAQKISLKELEQIIEDNEVLISKEILDKIPFCIELLDYLLLKDVWVEEQTLTINTTVNLTEKTEKALHNVIIQVSNGIISLILNNFSNNERVKENLFHTNMISTRELAKFRNRLAWEYRKNEYWQEPKNIFESQHQLFFLEDKGINLMFVYAARQEELNKLTRIRWSVTIILEIRDAIALPLSSLLKTSGNAIVYLLTQIIGRSIGLVGKGILQGIGNSLIGSDYLKKTINPNSKS